MGIRKKLVSISKQRRPGKKNIWHWHVMTRILGWLGHRFENSFSLFSFRKLVPVGLHQLEIGANVIRSCFWVQFFNFFSSWTAPPSRWGVIGDIVVMGVIASSPHPKYQHCSFFPSINISSNKKHPMYKHFFQQKTSQVSNCSFHPSINVARGFT